MSSGDRTRPSGDGFSSRPMLCIVGGRGTPRGSVPRMSAPARQAAATHAEMAAKLEETRADLMRRLRALASALGDLPLARFAEVAPALAGPVHDAVGRMERLGVRLQPRGGGTKRR